MNQNNNNNNSSIPADIGSQVAALRAEMQNEGVHTRKTLDKVSLAVDRLLTIEAQNQARDLAIAALGTKTSKLEDKVDDLSAAQAEARATLKGSIAVLSVLAAGLGSCGSWLVSKFGG